MVEETAGSPVPLEEEIEGRRKQLLVLISGVFTSESKTLDDPRELHPDAFREAAIGVEAERESTQQVVPEHSAGQRIRPEIEPEIARSKLLLVHAADQRRRNCLKVEVVFVTSPLRFEQSQVDYERVPERAAARADVVTTDLEAEQM